MSAASKVLNLIQDEEIEFVDFRFADILGKHHHTTFPAHAIDESTFEDGKMFDGSSIAGWKGITSPTWSSCRIRKPPTSIRSARTSS